MAVAKAMLLEPLLETELDINTTGLVVGGGVSGMTAARTLADQGYEVHLVERSEDLGGNAMSLYKTWKGESIQTFVRRLVDDVEKHPLIHVHKSTELVGVNGFVGNFVSELRSGADQAVGIRHGIAVLATGAHESRTTEYLYGQDPRVITHLDLDRRLIEGDRSLKHVRTAVFIQCVGSREPEHPYCSRVCCTHAVESSIELKRLNPDMAVYVLYRDVRTYGEREVLYTQARKEGVVFIRYETENKPRVSSASEGLDVVVSADILVLATAIVPWANDKLSQFFKVPVNGDGFFVEAHAKLLPVDFATEGVFLCGMAHYPKAIDESISQSLAAASRATRLLARQKVLMSGAVSEIIPALCSGCGTCASLCPYSAAGTNEYGKCEINPALCKGCGLCTASCRSGAIRLKGFEDAQIFAMIESV
jgi:heterodisulfide reductase subunit A